MKTFVAFVFVLSALPAWAGTSPVTAHGSGKSIVSSRELRGAYNSDEDVQLSACGQDIVALQQRLHTRLFISFENFKQRQLKGWFPGIKQWKVSRLYNNLIEKYVLNADPERLCQSGRLYWDEVEDSITGTGRQPSPRGYFIELEADLEKLGRLLKKNEKHTGLTAQAFEANLFEHLSDAYWDVRIKRESFQKLVRRY